jgi:stress-induced morphogen
MEAFVTSGVVAMAMAGPEIERLIRQAFPDAEVVVADLAGDGDHFAARIASGAFIGKSRIEQHKMVYAALQGHVGGALHALALETSVPK